MTLGEWILNLVALISGPLVFIGVPIFVFSGGYKKIALRPLQRCFSDLELHDSPQPGDVSFVYHTYRGFLVWFVQDEHHIYAPLIDANKLLSRLLRFNLTWGMLSYGALFVPFMAIGNYIAQKRSIANQ